MFVLRKRASALIRTLVFFPVVLPTVAVALLFQKLFQIAPQDGPVNELLVDVGSASVDWFGSPDTAFIVLVRHGHLALHGLLRRAALRRPGRHPRRHPRVGAARRRLGPAPGAPHRAAALVPGADVLVIFSINGTLKVFDSIVALTNGGPGNRTTPLTLYMFQTSFDYGDYGYGATIALLLTVVCLLVTLVVFRSRAAISARRGLDMTTTSTLDVRIAAGPSSAHSGGRARPSAVPQADVPRG